MRGAGGGKAAHLCYLWFLGVLNIGISVQYDRYLWPSCSSSGLVLVAFCSIFGYYATQHLNAHL